MRRGVGIGAVKNQQNERKKFQEKGKEIAELNLSQARDSMAIFKSTLEEFALKYKNQIRKDPEFRRQFQVMCSKIGIDPLTSSKGYWSNILGIGDFYYELGVQIVHVTIATRSTNGGIIDLNDLLNTLKRIRAPKSKSSSVKSSTNADSLSLDDIKRSIKKLEILGNGLRIINVNKKEMLVSVPVELTSDHTSIIALAEENSGGFVTIKYVENKLKWNVERIKRILNNLLQEGMVWLDSQQGSIPSEFGYYFPAIAIKTSDKE